MKNLTNIKTYLYFLVVEAVTIYAAYFAPAVVGSVWYLIMLLLYWRSKNEAFWLIVFFTTVDGFLGFFGLYITVVKAIPGLPAIEVAQLYLLLSIVKVRYYKKKSDTFYSKWLKTLVGFLAFLVIFGFTLGLSGEINVYLRVIKLLIPLVAFYTLPKLINTQEQINMAFGLLFLVTVMAFVAQLVALFTGFSPNLALRPVEEEMELKVGLNFRVLYNTGALIISMFGALYYLAFKGPKPFNAMFLYMITGICFVMAVLSATRGWMISMGLTITLFLIFVQQLNVKQVAAFGLLFVGFLFLGLTNETVSSQIEFSIARLLTLESLAAGDASAEGTLARLDERGPVVMEAWADSPIFGYGFSDTFLEVMDSHVGNQNLLLHAGIAGYILMALFFRYFILMIINRQKTLPADNIYKSSLKVFYIFLPGWVFLHSTSGQQFAYYGLPSDIIPQALFLSTAAFAYQSSKSAALPGRKKSYTENNPLEYGTHTNVQPFNPG